MQRLDASLVCQTYSRLVIYCNRDPVHADAMAEWADDSNIPGNAALSPTDHTDYIAAIHEPYHAAIPDMISRPDETGQTSL